MSSQKYSGVFYSDFKDGPANYRETLKKANKKDGFSIKKRAGKSKRPIQPLGDELQIGVVGYDK